MKPHLSEQEMAEWLLGSSTEAERHFRDCPDCYAEAEALRARIRLGRQWVNTKADRTEVFWARQRRLIQERIAHRQSVCFLRRAVLAAAAVLLCAALLLTRSPQPPVLAGDDAADNALLQQVESDVARDYPSALAPAVLLRQERSAALAAWAAQNPNRNHR